MERRRIHIARRARAGGDVRQRRLFAQEVVGIVLEEWRHERRSSLHFENEERLVVEGGARAGETVQVREHGIDDALR